MTRHKTSSRLLAMLLSLILVIGMLPTTAFADGYVAYIGNAGYTTLEDAVSNAAPGATILLTADDSTEQQIEISENLTIELDGHSLPNTAFKITAGTVTIGDRKGTGIINIEHAAGFVATENSRCSSSIYVTGTANVTLNNLKVEQCAEDDLEKAIFLGGSASLTINGGSYTGPKDAGVDAIFYYNNNTSSSLTINDGHFEANCALSVNKTPGTGGGTLVIRKATFVGNGTAFWIEEEYGGVTTQEDAERFLADSSGSYIVGSFDQANIVIGSGLFVSDGFTGPEYGSTDSDNPAELTPEDGDSITLLPQILGGDGSAYTYTWYKDSQVISGATGSSYTIESYQSPDDNGIYSVTVSQGSSSISLYWEVGEADSTPQLPGAGTEQSPYEISTPEQLMAFAQLVNGGSSAAYAKLTDDIDMSGQSWTGISINDSYTGVFDGAGHTISNLTGTEGLFANNAGTIKNVRLENVDITREGGNLGAVAGVNTGTVFNCISSGSIKGTGSDAWSVGGLIGYNNGGTLSGSASSCTVDGRTAGGLVGSNWQSSGGYGTITACIYTGTAENPVEGDRNYSNSTNVYYKDENGQWKSYPVNSATNEDSVLQSVNDYIIENGGAFNLSGDGTTYPTSAVSYLDHTENGFVTKYAETYTEINSENLPTTWNDGWYVVDGTVEIDSRVTVTGDVKLILKDGANLIVNGGISVPSGSTFTVYGQQDGTGNLTSNGTNGTAGIGGTADNVNFGTIVLAAKGKITATGDTRAAGIGGGGRMNNGQSVDGTIHIYCGTIEATGGNWAAGIGGGADSVTNCEIIIDGGTITAQGGENNVGIGGTDGSKTITINGGDIKAYGSGAGAGIGGSYNASGGSITITGGFVEAGSIGGGSAENGGPGGTIVISGGVVTADRIGAGGNNGEGTFSTGQSGDAVIFAGSITDQSGKSSWSGLIFEGGEGRIYGSSYTVDENLTIPENTDLIIESGKTLTVENGVTIKNNGAIKVNNGGVYSGDQPANKVTYQIDWDTDGDGTMDDTTYVAYDGMPAHEDGSKSADAQYTYTFTGWSPELAKVTEPAKYTAEFSTSINQYTVKLPSGEGYTVTPNGSTTVNYGTEFTFTITVKNGYSKTDEFAVKANGTELTEQTEGSYKVTVKGDTSITVEGVADTTAPAGITVSYGTDHFKEFLNTATFGLFFKDTVTVTISAVDEGSGVKEISYQLGDGELQTVAAENGKITFTVEPEFKGNIKNVTATDIAGNTSEGIEYEYFAVEKSGPSNVTVDTNGYESGKWINGDVTITVSGSETLSGIAKYQYSTDDGQSWYDMTTTEKTDAAATAPPNVTKAQLTVSESGTADYIFRAVSNAGNESTSTESVTVKIDQVEPTIAATADTGSYLTGDTIEITAGAGGSGITKVEVQTGNDSWTDITDSYEDGYTVTENGIYTFRVTNGAGVTASTSITYDKLDSVKPVVSIDSGEYISGNWTNKNVTMSVSNTAANLGTTSFQYKVGDGDWQTYNSAITVSEETDGTVYTFKAISASGVESAEASITVKLDKTVPDGDITIEHNSVKKFINAITFDLFFNKNVDVAITGTDNLSGVAGIEYYRSGEILTEEQVNAISDWTDYTSISVTAEDQAKFIYYVKITDEAGNIAYFGSDGVTFDLTAPVIAGVTDGATYYTTQSISVTDENFVSVTVNDVVQSGSSFTLAGNVEKTYTMVATDKAGNSTTVTVTMKPISSLEESIDGLTPDDVTSQDKVTVETVKEQMESIDMEDATEDEKAALQEILDKCDELIEKIEESAQAGNTENTDKVEDITADNVKPEDKDDLTAAKEDLENALENFGDNYTEEEKAEIQNKLDQIDDALESLEKVETVQDAISKLPDTIEPDDTDAEQLIHEAKDQYDALSDHEKTLLSEQLKEKLESLLGDLLDYRIIEGNGSKWTVGDDGFLTITANGPVEKFTGIEVDGKAVDAANYTVKSGSTIISLKPEYLNTLSVGKHTLTVIYTDGETSGEFEIVKNAETVTPETGDSSSAVLWSALMFIAVCGLTGAMIYGQKKKYVK
ncbi:MAG TPA: hypothetical protein IAA36_00785 [Candidatus Eubacterium pullicola]|nr:hypothetical protein [Candidatus Eubacterium pullicola]